MNEDKTIVTLKMSHAELSALNTFLTNSILDRTDPDGLMLIWIRDRVGRLWISTVEKKDEDAVGPCKECGGVFTLKKLNAEGVCRECFEDAEADKELTQEDEQEDSNG